MLHNRFYGVGGTEQVLFELIDILENFDHECIVFSTHHPHNRPSPYEAYFIDRMESYDNLGLMQVMANITNLVKGVIYSPEARRRVERLIDDLQPQIGHVHVIDHWISPSVLYALRAKGLPVVKSVNDHKLVCPNYLLYNPNKETVCEKCVEGHFYNILLERCHKSSFYSSALLCAGMYIHKWMGVYNNLIDIYMVSNRHKEQMLIRAGYDPQKIRVVPHPINVYSYHPDNDYGDYCLYFGRFTREKGILTLFRAVEEIPNIKLAMVGTGPQEKELVEWVRLKGLHNIVFWGPKWKEELTAILSKARFVIVPSEWYEGTPMAIYQSFAMGKAVIGSNIGGIPDGIDDGVNGLLFKPADSCDLRLKIKMLWDNPLLAVEMGRKARAWVETELNPQKYYERIISIYSDLLGKQPASLRR